jgi:NADH dehydrogenase
VVLVEAGPRVLPTFPEDLSAVALHSLERMGVQVLTGTQVTGCDHGGVQCGEERIAASTVVWAAGVVASRSGAWIEAARDRAGRIRVESDLSIPGQPDIFAVGDVAIATDPAGRPVPGNAPAAKQMGRYVGRVIAARALRRRPPPPFAYRHHGDLATIGRRSAVVVLGSIRLTGLIGWWFWGIAHVWYLIGFRSRAVVSFEWLWSYLTFQRGARLITGDGTDAAGGGAAADAQPELANDAAPARRQGWG